MKIELLAADSLGTRSMATYIETGDLRIIIDPGVALSPNRFSLPPHPMELERRDEAWQKITERTTNADIIIITHYHRDHHNPDHPEIFKDKDVFLKGYESHINYHQKLRAEDLLVKIKDQARRIESAEEKIFKSGRTRITFSPPLPHGRSEKIGFVVSVFIEADKTFLFTSDVQGMVLKEHIDFVLHRKPHTIYLDGPNTPMLGYKYFQEDLNASLKNIRILTEADFCRRLIIDHHLLRDPNWRSWFSEIPEKIETAASFSGKKCEQFEAFRRELYKNHPVDNVEKLGKFVES